MSRTKLLSRRASGAGLGGARGSGPPDAGDHACAFSVGWLRRVASAMDSSQHSPEHECAEDTREKLLARLYGCLVGRHLDLQLEHSREVAGFAARAEWQLIRRCLGNRVVARSEMLDRFATLACLARSGHPLRVLLVGPPGSGKSHLAMALADAVGGPLVQLDATGITEAGWSGVNLAEALGAAGGPAQLLGASVILEEADKLRVHRQAHGNAVDKYRGQQAQYLGMLDRAGRVNVGSGGSLAAADLHVILTGAFADAWWARAGYAGEVTPEMLIAYGLLPEFVDRLDHIVVLSPPSAHDLARILARALEGGPSTALRDAVAEFGYELVIEPGVYAFLAQALYGRGSTGTRAGRAIVEGAVHRLLADAIRKNLPVGSILYLTPDDLQIPRSRGEPPEGGGRGGEPGPRPAPRRR